MSVVVVLNRKGGSGKSTLATHLAAYAANQSISVTLGDIDRQQSSRTWLSIRQKTTQNTVPPILHWSNGGVGRLPSLPAYQDLLVLDTPGGLQGLELAKVVMLADVIVIPVCHSLFDLSSAADCIAELRTMPRVASGRCKLGIVGMRIDSRTGGALELAQWAAAQRTEYITHLRQSRLYVTCIEKGLTIFDAPASMVSFDLSQWKPIIEWLQPYLNPEPTPDTYKKSYERGVESPAQAAARVAAAAQPFAPPRSMAPMASRESLEPLKPVNPLAQLDQLAAHRTEAAQSEAQDFLQTHHALLQTLQQSQVPAAQQTPHQPPHQHQHPPPQTSPSHKPALVPHPEPVPESEPALEPAPVKVAKKNFFTTLIIPEFLRK
jgi:chromosome partitioning protein